MGKTNLIKCLSGLVALLYVFGVIGFDVHSCSASGEVFVSLPVRGATCHDLHSGHHHSCCDHGSECCGHHSESGSDGISDGNCCSDNLVCLSVTGTDASEEHHAHSHCQCVCGHCPLSAELRTASVLRPVFSSDAFPPEGHGHSMSGNIQSVLGIWRL